MISYKDEKNKREIIMKHYSFPINKKEELPKEWIKTYKHSQNCVDEIEVALKIENNLVLDANFKAKGCAVFLSSSDIFLEQIKNKNITEVKTIIQEYKNLIEQKEANEIILGPLVIFHNVKVHLNRLECARLIAETIEEVIN